VITAGIDFASQALKTAACNIVWALATAEVRDLIFEGWIVLPLSDSLDRVA
jgi:hypothetical protein